MRCPWMSFFILSRTPAQFLQIDLLPRLIITFS
ncbi:hypothetical protein ACVWYR_003153 [Pantoea agglomerans]